ncbi:hypothetical protein OA88_09080 [Flavobacterium sp. JRM]|nr:hypothetical protein OA88_09080 [Flavobacterium sp. JRM]
MPYAFYQINPSTKNYNLNSPDGSANPFSFFFKKEKIEVNSRNFTYKKILNHSLQENNLV